MQNPQSTSTPHPKPIFVRGHLAATLDQQRLEFVHQNISIYGVSGLPWGSLDPVSCFGRKVVLEVRIPTEPAIHFTTEATITREITQTTSHLGFKFMPLPTPVLEALQKRIQQAGFYPTEYIRKYPRIPSNHVIQTFPLRALIAPADSAQAARPPFPLITEVVNLSPNGTLLKSESQGAFSLDLDSKIMMTLEPRGWFPVPVKVQGQICRVYDELDPKTRVLTRLMGIKFTRVDDENRKAFLELLKDILGQLKNQG